jgi:hypothetical protein
MGGKAVSMAARFNGCDAGPAAARVGAPQTAFYRELLNSDATTSAALILEMRLAFPPNRRLGTANRSIALTIPLLAVVFLKPDKEALVALREVIPIMSGAGRNGRFQ